MDLIDKKLLKSEILNLRNEYGDYVKLTVDIENEWVIVGGELHADGEKVLLANGSKQDDIWGGGINFVDKLIDMGAQIILCDPHRATVIGLDRKFPLRGITMSSPDIRAGVALLIAALSAEGTSIISNVEQIDRGYQDIDKRLNNLGARIERFSDG